jgi:excisionase family DNA binding protein
MAEQAFTSGEVAQMCAVSKTTVIRWVDSGRLGAFQTPGGHRRVLAQELHDFMKRYGIPIPDIVRKGMKKVKQ